MVTIAYLLLASSFSLLLIFLLIKEKRQKKMAFLGFTLLYLLFIAMAFFNYKSSLANINEVKKQSTKLDTRITTLVSSNDDSSEEKTIPINKKAASEEAQPLKIEEHGNFTGKLGQKLSIQFTLTNNSNQDIENLKIAFNQNGFYNLMSIKSVSPKATIVKSTFSFGKLAAGSTETYTIEVNPTKAGSYESTVSFKNGEKFIKDNNDVEIKDKIKVNIYR